MHYVNRLLPIPGVTFSPQVTAQRDEHGTIVALCLDVSTERTLQIQRRFAYTVGGPAIVLAGMMVMKDRPVFGAFVAALGGACTFWHHASYAKVEEALGNTTAIPSPTSTLLGVLHGTPPKS